MAPKTANKKGKGGGKGKQAPKGGKGGKKEAPKGKTAKVQKTIQKKTKSKDNHVKGDVEVDEDARYTGTVVSFLKQRGFGFIKPDDLEIDGVSQLMCHWKEIKSDDRWPSLDKDLQVEFSVSKNVTKDGSKAYLKAKDVTLPGGVSINIQEESEDKLEYVGGDKNLRYTGKVQWFDFQKGFGFIKLDEGYDIPDEVPTEIRIQRQEISSGEEAARLRKDMEVEFGISKNKGGKYNCFNLTLPGGEPVSRTVVEEREMAGDDVYQGTVKIFSFGNGWIEPEDASALPADFSKKLKAFTEKRAKKSSKKVEELIYFRRDDMEDSKASVTKGSACTFKIYSDNHGVGACEVTIA
jgi:cold shock CspA family protein